MDKMNWGPQLWHSIHMIALNYPENPKASDKASYKTFFSDLGNVLPCVSCSSHYKAHLDELPIEPYLDGHGSLFEWSVKLHNLVNAKVGGPQWTVEQARSHFTTYEKTDNIMRDVALWVILASLVVGLPVGFVLYSKLKTA
jgi:hypothetical protein